MRIVSLIPEVTEVLGALGLGDAVVAVPGADVSNPERLAQLLPSIHPTLVFTSKTAAGDGLPQPDVKRIVRALRPRPSVYALEPRTLGGILSDIKTVGDATGRQQQARVLIEALRVRVDAVTLRSARALAEAGPRRIACLSRLAPPIAAGWWLAELVGLAGGLDVLDGLGRPPRAVTWAALRTARPDEIIYLPSPVTPGPRAVDLLEQIAALILPEAPRH